MYGFYVEQILTVCVLKFGLHKIRIKLLHWLRSYELFRRFVDADSENNFSLLLNLSRLF